MDQKIELKSEWYCRTHERSVRRYSSLSQFQENRTLKFAYVPSGTYLTVWIQWELRRNKRAQKILSFQI